MNNVETMNNQRLYAFFFLVIHDFLGLLSQVYVLLSKDFMSAPIINGTFIAFPHDYILIPVLPWTFVYSNNH